MQAQHPFAFLRRVLAVDAVSCGALGLGLIAFAPTLAEWLDLPIGLLREIGLILLPFAAMVGWLASRQHPSRIGVWIVIVLNAIWAVDSILLLVSGKVEPSALGQAFVIGQAIVTVVLAELEYMGLRRASQPVLA